MTTTETAVSLLADLRTRQIRLWLDGDKLRYQAPPNALTPDLREQLAIHKAEIITLLQQAVIPDAPLLQPQPRPTGPIPASSGQRRLWFLHQLAPYSPVYNVPTAVRLRGLLDVHRLQYSLQVLVRRHESLRTHFEAVDGQPVQVITPPSAAALSFTLVERAGWAEADAYAEITTTAKRPFLLDHPPLLRIHLFRLAAADHILLLNLHHIITDGWSMNVLLRELGQIYASSYASENELLHEAFAEMTSTAIQYADYTLWQEAWLGSAAAQQQVAFWREQLGAVGDIPSSGILSTDGVRPFLPRFTGDDITVDLPPKLAHDLAQLALTTKTTRFMVLLASFAVLLHRYSQQENLIIGVPAANRRRPEVAELIGFVVNTLPLPLRLTNKLTFRQVLTQVREMVLAAYMNQDLPLETMLQTIRPQPDDSYAGAPPPLFSVMFALQDENLVSDPVLPGMTAETMLIKTGTAKFDLTLSVQVTTDGLCGVWEYDADLFERDTVRRMSEHWQILLAGLVDDLDQVIARLPLLTAKEQAQFVTWNETAVSFPDATFPELFAAQAARTPEAVAFAFAQTSYTYQELTVRVNQLAHHLRGLGVGPEVPVAVCLARGPDLLVALLGVMAAGGAYVPLHPQDPPQRLAWLIADTAVRVILTHDAWRDRFAASAPLLCLDNDWPVIAKSPSTFPVMDRQPQQLAYMIYTSGSSGHPKGVMVTQRSLVNYLTWVNTVLLADVTADFPATTSVTFDASLKQLFAPLLRGASVWLLPDEVVSQPDALLQALYGHEAIVFNCVPALWQTLLDLMHRDPVRWLPPPITHLLIGGEAVQADLLAQTRVFFPQITIWNLYGPTETTANATAGLLAAGEPVTIGRPIANTQAYIVDANLQQLPLGVPGELLIGGVGVARGYRQQSTLTAVRFISLSVGHEPVTVYCTGDLARFLPDGRIVFLGRIDEQVKVRGYRIEPEEIAAVLQQFTGVRETAVLTRLLPDGDKQLLAFVTPADVDITALRQFLQERLPAYMIPVLLPLAALPRLPSGKIDRQQLLALEWEATAVSSVPPRTPLEQKLVDIWAEVLHRPQIGIHDNFFAQGGHSLQAAQIVTRMAVALTRTVSVSMLFMHPTIAALAAALAEDVPSELPTHDESLLAIDQPPPSSPGPYLTLVDQPLRPEDVGMVDAAALGYLRHQHWHYDRILYAQSGGQPILLGATETAWGRFAILMLPRFASDLYTDPMQLVQEVVTALACAGRMGAKTVSLTGLIPSATDYGRALLPAVSAHGNLPNISTGHAATTATVVLTVQRILAECGRELSQECVGFLGLGSIGAASLRLMLATQPHPKVILLCDLYSKETHLQALQAEIVHELGFTGEVQLVPALQQVPAAFYEATLIVGATNVPDILDVDALHPGTLLVDDSGPHCFNLEQAVHRFERTGDILFTEGGVLQLPQVIRRLRYVPRSANAIPVGTSLIDNPYEVMGCAFSSLLPQQFAELEATVGSIPLEMSTRYYRRLVSLKFRAGPLHSKQYRFAETAVSQFRKRFSLADGKG